MVLDTLKAAKVLTAAGAAQPLAEAIVSTVNDAISDNVATKGDIEKLQGSIENLEGDIEDLRGEVKDIRSDIKDLRDNGATKADIDSLRETSATKADIDNLRETSATKADISNLEARMYRALWMQAGGIVAAITALAGIAVAFANLIAGTV